MIHFPSNPQDRHPFHANCLFAACLLTFLTVLPAASAGELHDAAIKGDIVRMQSILNQNPRAANESNADGDTPLHSAALTGQNMAAQFLLANGADVNSRNTLTGATPLLSAAMTGHRTMAEILLAAGANVNQSSNQGTTPLHVAAYQGHKPMVELLLARSVNVNLKDQTGLLPVQWALLTDNKDIALTLLMADPEVQSGKSPVNTITPPAPYNNRETVKLREQILALTRALREADAGRDSAREELERLQIINRETIERMQRELDQCSREKQTSVDEHTARLSQANDKITELERQISLLINQAQSGTAIPDDAELVRVQTKMAGIIAAMQASEINRRTLNNEIAHLKVVLSQMRERLRQLQMLSGDKPKQTTPPVAEKQE